MGRSLSADLRFDDPTVSRRHSLVYRDPEGGARILDDRSLNGVFVNGERVDLAELNDGDEIAIGRFTLFFLHASDPEAGRAPPPRAPRSPRSPRTCRRPRAVGRACGSLPAAALAAGALLWSAAQPAAERLTGRRPAGFLTTGSSSACTRPSGWRCSTCGPEHSRSAGCRAARSATDR